MKHNSGSDEEFLYSNLEYLEARRVAPKIGHHFGNDFGLPNRIIHRNPWGKQR
jgi:hypothetical protein